MKQLFTKSIISLVFASVFTVYSFAQKDDAGVFYLNARVHEVLIDSRKVETTSDRVFLTGYSDRVEVPEELLDSVRSVTNQLVSKKLGVKSEMLYLKDKKGRKRATLGMSIFPGMPFVNLRPVRKEEDRKYYVKIYMDVSPQGKVTTSTGKGVANHRPKVDMRVDIYNRDGKIHYSNRVVLRNFETLFSHTEKGERVNVTESEVLTAERLVEMYILALEAALFNE